MKNLYNWCITNKQYDLINEWCAERNGVSIKDISRKSNKKYWWKCKKGHMYKATIEERTIDKIVCPVCQSTPTLPEMIIYHYISLYYPAIMNYKPIWADKREIDIFSSKANIAWQGKKYHSIGIEYDGANYHRDKSRDLEKNKLCEEHGIHLIRIRENACPLLSNTEDCIRLPRNHTVYDIAEAVKEILFRLGIKSPQVDIKTDLSLIQAKYETYTHST